MIIGSGGSGKSTLARRLGELTGLPVIHLDREFWHLGWVKTPKAEWKEKVVGFAAGGSWITDGNFGGTMALRWARADLVIFLDFGTLICLWRVIRRRNKIRPDMPDGMEENPFFSKGYFKFLWWIASFRLRERPEILAMREKYPQAEFVRLRNDREVGEFLGRVYTFEDTRFRADM